MTVTAPDGAATQQHVPNLELVSILTNDLPSSLCTEQAPATYCVPFVLSRRVTAEEKKALESVATREVLGRHGAGEVQLTVADRRLLVDNTSLEELAAGLSTVLADEIRRICDEIDATYTERAERARLAQSTEAERVGRVQDLASRVPLVTSERLP